LTGILKGYIATKNIMKIALSIICILIISVSFRGILSIRQSIDTDNPSPQEIKRGLDIVLGIIAFLALLLLVLINIPGFLKNILVP
jgi:hypothetical protein